jgi:hypothetical protein
MPQRKRMPKYNSILFKHPVALMYHLFHIYFALKCNLSLVTLLPHYIFRPYTAILACLLSC